MSDERIPNGLLGLRGPLRLLAAATATGTPLLLLGVVAASLGSGLGTGCQIAPAATVDHGAYLYSNYCSQCHEPDGRGQESIGAPSIAGLPKYYVLEQLHKFRSGVRGANFDDAEGLRMRPMSLTLHSEMDVEAVALYIESLPPRPPPATLTGGDPAKGKEQFTDCVACHGPDGKGMEPIGSPPLLVQPDWYLARQIGKFKAGIRGSRREDVKGLTMSPMAGKLEDDQAVKDAVAYILTLRPAAAPTE